MISDRWKEEEEEEEGWGRVRSDEERLQRRGKKGVEEGTKDLQMKERRMIRDLHTDMHGFDTV